MKDESELKMEAGSAAGAVRIEGATKLSVIFDLAPSFMAVARGPDHVFERANPAYLRLVGNRDIVGRPVREALPEIVEQGLIEVLDRVYATGEPFIANELPMQLDRRGGGELEERFLSFVYQALTDESGSSTGIVAHGVDVTEQVRAREIVAESEAHFRSLIEHSHDKVTILDLDGTIRYESPAAERLLGWSTEELLGRNVLDLIHPEDRTLAVDGMRTAAESTVDGGSSVQLRIRHRDGSWRWFESVGHARTDGRGRVQLVTNSRDITDRKAAEEELRRSADHLRKVLDGLPASVGVLTPEGRVSLVNRASREAVESPDQILGRSLLDSPWWTGSPDRRLLEEALRRGAEGQSSRFDMRVNAGSETLVFDFSLAPLLDEEGRVTHLVPSAIDVTERVHARQAVEDREARFQALVELLPQLVWATDSRGYHYYFNQRWYDYTGMPREGGQGWNWKDYLHPDDYERSVAVWQDCLETGEPYEIEYRFRRASDGAYRWFIGRALPVHGPSGEVVSWYGTCTDVHDERVARESAEKSEQRFMAVARAVKDVVWDWDIETDEVWWNSNAGPVLKLDPAELAVAEEPWAGRIHEADRGRVLASMRAALESDAETWQEEYRFLRGDGAVATIFDRGHIIRDDAGQPTRMIGSMADITERNRLEAELRHSQKLEAVGKLAGGVAHDFNNILAAITNYSEIVLEDLEEGHTVRGDVEEIRRAANRAATLTRQLLAFGRQQMLQPRHVRLNDVVANMESMLRRLIGADISLVTRLAPDLRTVFADPGQLEQVLVNLVVNARDAMPDGGTVTISTANVDAGQSADRMRGDTRRGSRDRCVELVVSDTGVGMDATTLARAFEPFFTTKEAGKGTGLGLATVHGIVTQSGGSLEAASEPGHGATIRVKLPASSGDEMEHAPEAPATGPAEALPATVLLVEDEDPVRVITTRALTRRGYRVLEARDGREALALLDETDEEVDVVLTDLVMPKMGGLELVDRIRGRGLTPGVVFMSGYAEDEVLGQAATDATARFLEKPFTIDQLLSRIADAAARVAV